METKKFNPAMAITAFVIRDNVSKEISQEDRDRSHKDFVCEGKGLVKATLSAGTVHEMCQAMARQSEGRVYTGEVVEWFYKWLDS